MMSLSEIKNYIDRDIQVCKQIYHIQIHNEYFPKINSNRKSTDLLQQGLLDVIMSGQCLKSLNRLILIEKKSNFIFVSVSKSVFTKKKV